jgi:hypothetical protein
LNIGATNVCFNFAIAQCGRFSELRSLGLSISSLAFPPDANRYEGYGEYFVLGNQRRYRHSHHNGMERGHYGLGRWSDNITTWRKLNECRQK